MNRNEFVQAVAVSAARGGGPLDIAGFSGTKSAGMAVAHFAHTVGEELARNGYFKDSDPPNEPADPRLLSALDALRNSNRVATGQLAALREENAALRQQLEAARAKVVLWEKMREDRREGERVLLRRLAGVLLTVGKYVEVTTANLQRLDASDWKVDVAEITTDRSSVPVAFAISLNMIEDLAPRDAR